MKIVDIIALIDFGTFTLPEFQRGYVWNREQVKKFVYSLYNGYPTGSLLLWNTDNATPARNQEKSGPCFVKMILDGQQRVTSLYGLIKGTPPQFFDGNPAAFTNLYFNMNDESFEFFSPLKMQNESNWVNVTELLKNGIGPYITSHPSLSPQNLAKLNQLDRIKEVDLLTQEISNRPIDDIIEIFNNINSGGTKLTKGDLALAKICGQWPDGRIAFKTILKRMEDSGYRNFEMEWLLRCVTICVSGKPYYSELSNYSIREIQENVLATEKYIITLLNQVGSRLGLDHDRVLTSRYSFAVMLAYLKENKKPSNSEWNHLLFWYIHTILWGRYSSSTESTLAQDLIIFAERGIDGLIDELRSARGGNLKILADDFQAWGLGSRFYPLLYLLSRIGHAKDWGSGMELSDMLLGRNAALELHHLFPKSILYENGYKKNEVNALGNFTFLTKETNLEISNRPPADYIPEYQRRQPGAVETHWIPCDDSTLLEIRNYPQFLKKRNELLALAANSLLSSLYNSIDGTVETNDKRSLPIKTENDVITQLMLWMRDKKLDMGEMDYELCGNAGNLLATFDLVWPNGIQPGLSHPLALLLDEPPKTLNLANQYGFKYFTDIDSFKEYVQNEYLNQ